MKYLLFALALMLSNSAWAARTAFQARCEDTMARTLSVLTAKQNGYSVDNTRSIRALTMMKGPQASNHYVLGLTRTESRVSIGVNGAMLSDPVTGYECVAPRIEVSLYYIPIVIYVGSEFAPGSCAYKEVLAHEMRHLDAYVAHLPKVEAIVRKTLAQRFDARPLYAPAGQARVLLAKEIDSSWMPYIKRNWPKPKCCRPRSTPRANMPASAKFAKVRYSL
ncbi:hypothetical protein [Massilia cavernae]|uniref:hypothetical protein n=1 Tax=Massilia cavernae TaxID=2320864 RepID=UPI001E5DD7E7|nr:hypothetical protein [Massilia cavernae]